jgi:hypothetical protein
MRIQTTTGLLILLLSLPAGWSQAQERPQTEAVEVDLGTATLDHLDVTLGPFGLAGGLSNRAMLGTYTLPWMVGLAAPGSVVPNAFGKIRLFDRHGASASVSTGLFYARLERSEHQDLDLRAWIWPVRTLWQLEWRERFSTTVELTSVFASLTGDRLSESGTRVYGVAVAQSGYAGLIQRWRATDRLSVWGRFRVLLGHSPVVAEADSQLSESVRVNVQARASAAELTSGVAGVGGVHLQWSRWAMSVGAGYGTWFLPGIYLPVGENTAIGEFDLYYRF